MTLIRDPDLLRQGIEVLIDAAERTIGLLRAGNLSDDGVTLKALYSFCKEAWKEDDALIKHPFPFVPITDESFEVVNGWNFADHATRHLIRTAGWSVVAPSGAVIERWAGIMGLGNVDPGEQPYYSQGQGAVDVELPGQVNQAIQVYSDPNGDGSTIDGFDRRGELALFIRSQGRTYAHSTLSQIGVSELGPQAYRFPLSTAADLKISATDAQITADAPYSGMAITYLEAPQQREIGGSTCSFGVVIDANGGTAEQVYAYVQHQLRQSGRTASALLQFTGDNLKTLPTTNPAGGGSGVYLDNYQAADTNRVAFTDNGGVERREPFLAVCTLQFNANLAQDPDAIYRVFHSTGYGTASALLVEDNAGNPVSGAVGGNTSLSFTFDYDGNQQGGRLPGSDAPITVVAIGLATGQYVSASGTISRSTENSVSLVAPLERNYQNP